MLYRFCEILCKYFIFIQRDNDSFVYSFLSERKQKKKRWKVVKGTKENGKREDENRKQIE